MAPQVVAESRWPEKSLPVIVLPSALLYPQGGDCVRAGERDRVAGYDMVFGTVCGVGWAEDVR